jgi:hypothetical protein
MECGRKYVSYFYAAFDSGCSSCTNPTSEEDEEVSPTASLSLAAEIHEDDDEPYDRKTGKVITKSQNSSQSEE